MKTEIEISCPCQRDNKMSVQWCDDVQYQQLCGGCIHNEGRKRSKYQQRNDLNSQTGNQERR